MVGPGSYGQRRRGLANDFSSFLLATGALNLAIIQVEIVSMIPEDAVTKAEVESVLSRIRQVRANLIRVERESGGSYDLCSVVRKLDEVIRRLNPL
jgi:hypothetical protein